MKYIHYLNAEIRWDIKSDQELAKFKVYEATKEDIKKFLEYQEGECWEKNHIFFYKDYSYSLGRDCSWWTAGTKDSRLFEMIRLLLEFPEKKDRKLILYEVGKIDEFESFRLLFYHEFNDILPDHSFEQFKEALYPNDISHH
jgi:hypothetical protein